jgi:uncharacterized protein YuzE
MKIEFDPTVNALYLRLRSGPTAATVELSDSIYLDIDDKGQVLGAEFVDADAFFSILRSQGGQIEIPDRVDQAVPA